MFGSSAAVKNLISQVVDIGNILHGHGPDIGVAEAHRNTSTPSRTNSLQPPPQDNSCAWIGYKLNLNNYL